MHKVSEILMDTILLLFVGLNKKKNKFFLTESKERH